MAAITIGSAGLLFGIATAEVGGILQSFEQRISRDKKEVKNETAEVAGVAYYNMKKTLSGNFYTQGTTTIAAIAPGSAYVFANTTTAGNGITTGGVYIDEVTVALANEDFKKISFSASQYPLIA